MKTCPDCGHGRGMHRDIFDYIGGDTCEKKMMNKCFHLQGIARGLLSDTIVYCGCRNYEKSNLSAGRGE